MAMSDTEMAMMMGANQLAAMRPVNPGAFSGVEAGMMPPTPQGQGAMPAMPSGPTMPPEMMQGQGPSINMNDQEGMMRYIQEKARQIRERMNGQGAMSDADMGALEAVMRAMPPQNQATAPAGAMSDRERMMMQGAK